MRCPALSFAGIAVICTAELIGIITAKSRLSGDATNISEVVGNAHIEELERIKQQIEKQQTLLVKMTAASEDYSKVVDKIYALQREQEEAMAANVNYKAGKEQIQEMIEYLKSQPKRVTAYDEQLARKLIKKIAVYDDHLDFLFKSEI